MKPLDSGALLDFPLTGCQLIEAGAGTGKTYTIANLYLRHVLAGREVGEILVVTFTNAATDELRGRIRARLYQAQRVAECLESGPAAGLLRQLLEIPDGDSVWAALGERHWADVFGDQADRIDSFLAEVLEILGRDEFLRRLFRRLVEKGTPVGDRLTLAVRSMDQAAIHTIHGFCQRALREFAFLGGQPFEAELGEDEDLRRQAIADWWRRTLYPLPEGEVELVWRLLGGFDGFNRLLRPLLAPTPKTWMPPVPDPETIEKQRLALARSIASLRDKWAGHREEIGGILERNDRLSRAKGKGYHPDELACGLEDLDRFFASEGFVPPVPFRILTMAHIRQSLKKTGRDAPPDHVFFHEAQSVWQRLEDYRKALKRHLLADAAREVRHRLAERKSKVGLLTFDDLLTRLHDALRGDNGAELAGHLGKRHPVALIDEFQDTDAIQYHIFRRIYREASDTSLVMIGDPKQAIYSFRGGDIFTYLEARRDVGEAGIWTLDTNWRSTPQVVEAVNRIFARGDPFVFKDIPYRKATAANKAHEHLVRGGRPVPALTVWTLPADGKTGKALSLDKIEAHVHAAVADEIARLLREAGEGRVTLGTGRLQPGDIAVLVRSGHEAAGLKKALKRRGVNAVAVLRDRIWETPEAASLLTLLESVAAPEDRGLARRALAAGVLELNAGELHRRLEDAQGWIEWVDHLMSVRERWLKKGFMAAFQHLMHGLDLPTMLARCGNGERRLTNLLHLAELLQQASRSHPGIDALIAWFRHQREAGGQDAAELRLESDENLVRIVTIHASKGLEYPVVFVPYLWRCRPRDKDKNGLLQWHRDGRACVTADWNPGSPEFLAAEKERLAEDVRLAYVALTRARNALWLVWGGAGSKAGHAGQTALAWLLHPLQTPEDLEVERPQVFDAASPPGREAVLERLEGASSAIFRVEPLPQVDRAPVTATVEAPLPLEAAAFTGAIATDWRIQSYSALTRDLHQPPTGMAKPDSESPFPFRFPAGPHVGSFLHLLLEKLAFHQDVAEQTRRLAPVLAPRFGIDIGEELDLLGHWMETVVGTALDESGLCLERLDPARQLRELAFDFSTGLVDPATLDALAREHGGREDLPPIGGQRFRGLVTGVIDLVFESGGRYYLADYKSNLLGRTCGDYAPEKLEEEIGARRYDIQYLLYTVALHRYLRQRLPGYDYETHFGGVFYLFLRGMGCGGEKRQGVWFRRPDPVLIRRLDLELFAHSEETP